ncbi:MAG TPA: pyruvate kinase, partial [Pirellulales bacterium]|nr:pyruvate kinase [Pirellulales bacterium]
MSSSRVTARVRTKIVATVGPACRAPDQMAELIEAGADVLRLNMAHGDLEEHEETLAAIREVGCRLGRPIGVLADLAGPKIRLGELYGGEVACAEAGEVRFVRGNVSTHPGELVCTYARLIDEL